LTHGTHLNLPSADAKSSKTRELELFTFFTCDAWVKYASPSFLCLLFDVS